MMAALSSAARISALRFYVLLLCAGFFLWPVALGIPEGMPRMVWVVLACAFVGISSYAAYIAVRADDGIQVSRDRFPWWFYGVAVMPALLTGMFMPLTFFGDEETIVLPTLTAFYRVIDVTGWVPLLCMAAIGIAAGVWFIKKFPLRFLWAVIGVFGLIAIGISLIGGGAQTEFVRYPPLMHLVQGLTIVVTHGSGLFFRLPSILWWLILGWAVWYLLPTWSQTARFLLFIAIGLTPLGWTYRILLYQTPGEITLAIIAIILIANMVRAQVKSNRGGFIGIIFALWIMQRPTALAPCIACAVLLYILRYRRAAWDIVSIALPIGVLWVLVYLIGSFQYDFLKPGSERVWTLESLLLPIRETLRMLPAQLHPVGWLIAIAGTAWVCFYSKINRIPLLIAWYIAIINTSVHQLLTISEWYGYGRFNALLILPLAFVIAGLWEWAAGIRQRQLIVLACVALLLVVTPWNFPRFLQELRAAPSDQVERTVTGGLDPTPLPKAIEEMLLSGTKPVVILSPSHTFLDIFIARGLLTPEERTAIINRSAAWTPADLGGPVVIQAANSPLHYQGNISPEQDERLRTAAQWARMQPTVRREVYGQEETLIVN